MSIKIVEWWAVDAIRKGEAVYQGDSQIGGSSCLLLDGDVCCNKSMNQQSPPKQESSEGVTIDPEASSPTKTDQELKRERKKKERALKDFLSKPQGEAIEVPKKAQEEVERVGVVGAEGVCKVCGEVGGKAKQCEFCKDSVCLEHIRKKRKMKNTNKFVRICDDCEDKQLYDKYRNSESKAEEALAMQQMIVEAKRNELAELAAGKQARLQMLRNKRQQLDEEKREYEAKIRNGENDLGNKGKKMEGRVGENRMGEEELQRLEESLPRPLDDDYSCLVEQNSKITRELVKYEKLCAEALKAKSTREKELYEAYYNWEKKQTSKAAVAKKKEECTIY